ncbi:MAG: hypothetical protein ACK5UY_02455 [Holosporales bacterium]
MQQRRSSPERSYISINSSYFKNCGAIGAGALDVRGVSLLKGGVSGGVRTVSGGGAVLGISLFCEYSCEDFLQPNGFHQAMKRSINKKYFSIFGYTTK